MTSGPTWMDPAEWANAVTKYRAQGRSETEIRDIATYLQRRGPRQPRTRESGRRTDMVTRSDYVPADQENEYLLRTETGEPLLKLIEAGDRLVIRSLVNGGGLINPKSSALRHYGLIATYARGDDHYAKAFRTANLSPGQPVELHREYDNPHDKNAVALHAPGAANKFGYVQRGKAPAVAHRIDADEHLAGISLRGPKAGRSDDTAFILIGTTADLSAMTRFCTHQNNAPQGNRPVSPPVPRGDSIRNRSVSASPVGRHWICQHADLGFSTRLGENPRGACVSPPSRT